LLGLLLEIFAPPVLRQWMGTPPMPLWHSLVSLAGVMVCIVLGNLAVANYRALNKAAVVKKVALLATVVSVVVPMVATVALFVTGAVDRMVMASWQVRRYELGQMGIYMDEADIYSMNNWTRSLFGVFDYRGMVIGVGIGLAINVVLCLWVRHGAAKNAKAYNQVQATAG